MSATKMKAQPQPENGLKELTAEQKQLARFKQKTNALLDTWSDLSEAFPPPPVGADPQETVDALLPLLVRFNVPWGEQDFVTPAAERLVEKATGAWAREDLTKLLKKRLTEVYERLGDALNAGGASGELLVSKDFGGGQGVRTLDLNVYQLSKSGSGTLLYAAGELDALPDGHHARQLLSREDCYQLDSGRTPVLILGPVAHKGLAVPRAFYATSWAASLTRTFRDRQKAEEARKAEQERQEAERKARQFAESPEGQLQRQVALQLGKLGVAPEVKAPDDPAEYAVRVGPGRGPILDKITAEQRARAEERAKRDWEGVQEYYRRLEERRQRNLAEEAGRQEAEGNRSRP